MTPANIAYLILVLSAFGVFVGVLGFTSVYVKVGERPKAKVRAEPARPAPVGPVEKTAEERRLAA